PPAGSAARKDDAPAAADSKAAALEKLMSKHQPAEVADDDTAVAAGETIVTDPESGAKLMRVPKRPPNYAKNGRLHSSIVPFEAGLILREDAEAWYVAVPPPIKISPASASSAPEDLATIYEMPAGEAETVTPAVSADTFGFEEISAGLPRSGMWRDNFALADVLGLGRPQIIAPPPRLTGGFLRVYQMDRTEAGGWRWMTARVEWENPGRIAAAYGATSVADFDGDGRLDIVFAGHGVGPAIAFNKGDGKFVVDRPLGLPRQMSSQALDVGDVNGDGRPDILAISDEGEDGATAGKPRQEGDYLRGFDARLFINEKGAFREVHAGLAGACFAYTMALAVPKEGRPFYTSGCRYYGGRATLYEYDPAKEEFSYVGGEVLEPFAYQTGAAVGTYCGRPAAFSSYFKRTPGGSSKKIDGQGVTVYYREADGTWKAKRIVKTLRYDAESQAIAVADLNGDGLDDVVWGDESTKRLRVFFQTPAGEFEELAASREPSFENHPTSIRIADVDGDGKPDVVMMYTYFTPDETKLGGFRVFRGLAK
ncbi:MAG TPA: VCBS repeat-containing protein, partial [Terriglobales bacterium]|nr:VCBS repeat-containing protein [Terriglobales bacterium]